LTYYGEFGGRIYAGGRINSVWWKNLSTISEGVDLGVGNWFLANLGHRFVDLSSTLFWWDPRLEGGGLKDRFSHLFYLDENKMVTVYEMNQLGWERIGRDGSGVGVYLSGRRSRLRSVVHCYITL